MFKKNHENVLRKSRAAIIYRVYRFYGDAYLYFFGKRILEY